MHSTNKQALGAPREVVLAAVGQHGAALEVAAEALRADRELVCGARARSVTVWI